jgi:hypothetical protein
MPYQNAHRILQIRPYPSGFRWLLARDCSLQFPQHHQPFLSESLLAEADLLASVQMTLMHLVEAVEEMK